MLHPPSLFNTRTACHHERARRRNAKTTLTLPTSHDLSTALPPPASEAQPPAQLVPAVAGYDAMGLTDVQEAFLRHHEPELLRDSAARWITTASMPPPARIKYKLIKILYI